MGAFTHGVYTLKGLTGDHCTFIGSYHLIVHGGGVSRTAESTGVQIFPPLSDDGCVHSVLTLLIMVEEENPLKVAECGVKSRGGNF